MPTSLAAAPSLLRPPLTYADYEQLDDNPGARTEVIEGALMMSPAPRPPHQDVAGRLYAALLYHLDAHPEQGRVFVAPLDVILHDDPAGATIVQPDIVFVAGEHADRLQDRGVVGAPDLVVEVLSPGTATYDRTLKLATYARFGVAEVWLIDPATRRTTIYRTPRAEASGYDDELAVGRADPLESPLLAEFSRSLASLLPREGA